MAAVDLAVLVAVAEARAILTTETAAMAVQADLEAVAVVACLRAMGASVLATEQVARVRFPASAPAVVGPG